MPKYGKKSMKIKVIESGPAQTNGFLLYDEKSKEAAVVDAPLESAQKFADLIKELDLNLKFILLTHSHWDHFGDSAELQRLTGANIYIHPDDEYRMLNPSEHAYLPLPFEIKAVKNAKYYLDGDKVKIGSLKLEVMHAPGHTEGGVCLVERSKKVVFTGDALFNGSIGRTDLPGGSPGVLKATLIRKICALPEDFKVYPGHGPTTTIGDEKASNPFIIEFSAEVT